MTARVIRCSRCQRKLRNPRTGDGWNVTVKAGVVHGYLCPGCQTAEENAEAVINESTTEYLGVNVDGFLIGRAKVDC